MDQRSTLITNLQLCGVPLKQGEPLCRHTSFQIGGPAAVMVFPETEAQIKDIYRLSREARIRPLVLGAGTNVLAPDEGLEALIIETKTNFNGISDLGDGVLEAESGATLSRLAAFAAERGLTGLEFAHGIPGTVGGGLFMNAGAYGGELRQVAAGADVLYPYGTVAQIPAEELDLGYRKSRFMGEECVILRVRFRLQPGDRDEIKAKMAELMGRRKASQPLEYPSAGSTFKRPAQEGVYAAALIDQAGLKGLSAGGAQVSEKHAGFVINAQGATAKDVKALMAQVQEKVFASSGIRLEPEVRILGGDAECDF